MKRWDQIRSSIRKLRSGRKAERWSLFDAEDLADIDAEYERRFELRRYGCKS